MLYEDHHLVESRALLHQKPVLPQAFLQYLCLLHGQVQHPLLPPHLQQLSLTENM
jgi:hypothetical protein